MLNAETIEQKLPGFAKTLERRHSANGWKEVLNKTASMLMNLGKTNFLMNQDLSSFNKPVLTMLGDRDKMVSLEETVLMYKKIPGAALNILPLTPHPIEQVDERTLAFMIHEFLDRKI